MEDLLAPQCNPMLIECCPLNDLSLDGIIQRWQQLQNQRFQNNLGRNAIDEQFVQFLPGGD